MDLRISIFLGPLQRPCLPRGLMDAKGMHDFSKSHYLSGTQVTYPCEVGNLTELRCVMRLSQEIVQRTWRARRPWASSIPPFLHSCHQVFQKNSVCVHSPAAVSEPPEECGFSQLLHVTVMPSVSCTFCISVL